MSSIKIGAMTMFIDYEEECKDSTFCDKVRAIDNENDNLEELFTNGEDKRVRIEILNFFEMSRGITVSIRFMKKDPEISELAIAITKCQIIRKRVERLTK